MLVGPFLLDVEIVVRVAVPSGKLPPPRAAAASSRLLASAPLGRALRKSDCAAVVEAWRGREIEGRGEGGWITSSCMVTVSAS